jgi:hypothetical protein
LSNGINIIAIGKLRAGLFSTLHSGYPYKKIAIPYNGGAKES